MFIDLIIVLKFDAILGQSVLKYVDDVFDIFRL
jgi:hypothetical protein